MIKTDYLIIGSGIAGLSLAIKLARTFPQREVLILTKSTDNESSTKLAQGGIASVSDTIHDSHKKHVEDTLIAGDGECKKEVVEMVVRTGPRRIKELMDLGVQFDKTESGEFDLAKEGGHSNPRIFHAGDATGSEILNKLIQESKRFKNIKTYNNFFAIELITLTKLNPGIINQQKRCFGVYAFNNKDKKTTKIFCSYTIIATGGAGQVYATTTNPEVATGDGIAMALRAGVETENMEFIQFHPTALYNPTDNPSFLISEATRGLGAILKTFSGKAFMRLYDPRGSLAPRDIVARAVYNEIKKSGLPHVYLDCRGIVKNTFLSHFPNISNKCNSLGINPSKDMIPVAPAAHYTVGGIKTDLWGRTNIKNLYAIGECSSTGLHGANRLASNSLLEGVVFAHNCYLDLFLKKPSSVKVIPNIPELKISSNSFHVNSINIFKNNIKKIMNEEVGIIRTDNSLSYAYSCLENIYRQLMKIVEEGFYEPNTFEALNLATVAREITRAAINRKENKGLHFNKDKSPKNFLRRYEK